MQHRHLLPLLLPLLVLAACAEQEPPTAPAETGGLASDHTPGHKLVNSLADPGNGPCNATQCTLREAIKDPQSTEISVAPGLTGTITLAAPAAGGGTLTINKTLSITGPSAGIVIRRRSTDPEFRIFLIGTGRTVTLTNLTIRGGRADDFGGGIVNLGTLRLTNSTVAGNSAAEHGGGIINLDGTLTLTNTTVSGNATSGIGGGIQNNGTAATLRLIKSVVAGNSALQGGGIFNIEGTLTLTDSRVSSNSADFGGGIAINGTEATLTLIHSTVLGNSASADLGGGILNDAGTITLTNTTVSGNATAGSGGGIMNRSGGISATNSTVSSNSANADGGGISNLEGRLNLTNSTVSRNSAAFGDGGGIVNSGTTARLKLRNTTVARNSATQNGGGIRTSGPLTLTNSLVALNTAAQGPDVLKSGGVTVAARFSLLGIRSGSGVSDGVNGNQVGSLSNPLDPKLGPLADNGGPTRTHALLLGSPAIDAASTPDCPTTDQRGVLRPQGAACDIGSYERK